jgi:sodium/proline symporter
MILIGAISAKIRTGSLSDFFLGGRRMKDWVVALSAVVSGRSAWLVLGMSGMAYTMGLSSVWAVLGYILVELFLFMFMGKRLRRYTEINESITLPDFFEARFKDKLHVLRAISVAIIVIFMVAYVAAQFNAGGKAMAASFGMTTTQGLWLTAIIVLAYTMLGGFFAVSITDVVQALFMILGLVILPAVAVVNFGGLGEVLTALRAQEISLLSPWTIGLIGAIGFLGIGLGSPGNPHMLVRYMSSESPQGLRRAALLGTCWNVVMAWGAIFVGLVGRAYFPLREQLPGADTERLFPHLASVHLHPVLFGFTVAAVFAAIMSTADSQLLVAASGITRDIYQKILRRGKNISERKMVHLSRLAVLVLAFAAIGLGAAARELVFWLVLFAWGGLGASFGPAVILSLFWKRTTKWGIVAGFVSGTLVTVVWNSTPALKQRLYHLIPAFFASALLVVLVSLVTKAPAEAQTELQEISPKYRFRGKRARG